MKRIFFAILISFGLLTQCSKSSETSTSQNASGEGKGGSTARFAIAGNYLYSVDETNLKAFDISDPLKPVLKNDIPIGFQIETIFPFKDKLFIGSTTQVYIFSLDDPARPKALSTAISPSVLRRCDPVVAKDTVAFATLRTNGACGGTQSILAIYDIKDIEKPFEKASFSLGEPYGLGYADDVLYVCDKQMGLLVFDIKDPYQPILLKTLSGASFSDVIPYGNTLICWTDSGIRLYDISDNKNPVFLANI